MYEFWSSRRKITSLPTSNESSVVSASRDGVFCAGRNGAITQLFLIRVCLVLPLSFCGPTRRYMRGTGSRTYDGDDHHRCAFEYQLFQAIYLHMLTTIESWSD